MPILDYLISAVPIVIEYVNVFIHRGSGSQQNIQGYLISMQDLGVDGSQRILRTVQPKDIAVRGM